jgi:hypothetical protein
MLSASHNDLLDPLITEIAYQTALPISYFSKAPENWLSAGSLLFRARTSISKREVTQSLRDAEHVFGLAHSMAKRLEISVSLRTIDGDSKEAARKTRALLDLASTEPVHNLIHLLERAGVWVLVVPAMKRRDAFCCWAECRCAEVVQVGRNKNALRGEFFNLFNRPTFGAPSTNIDSSSGVQVTSTLNTSREVELSLKGYF